MNDAPILKQSAWNNPYEEGLRVIYTRMKWDLLPMAWVSRQRIKQWKDRYKGQKAVIVCNGPSLLKSDLSLLKGVFTFGLNKINLLFDKSDFRPSCIVSVNPLVIEQNVPFFNETNLPLFLAHECRQMIKFRKNVIFMHSAVRIEKFARDCSMSVSVGGTVTNVALQLAYHMGFEQVALIGCDHNFATKGPSNKEVVSSSADENHFDPNYFGKGVKWHLPDLIKSEIAYKQAGEVYEASGRKIYNCTEGGHLEIFERMSLADFVRS